MTKKPKVFVGVSGGVDSSVALALLKKEGHDVTGVFLKTWYPEWLPCNWKEERRSAMRVCATLGVPFLTIDCEAEYKKEVVEVIYKIAKDKQLLSDFVQQLLTPHEFENIGVRWQIVKRLGKGEHQGAIAADLHLGVATITRGSREMRKKEGGFRRTLKFLK